MKRNVEDKACSRCNEKKTEEEFSKWEWKKSDAKRACLECASTKTSIGIWACIACKKSQQKDEFSDWLSRRKVQRKDSTVRCNTCNRKDEAERRKQQQEVQKFLQRRK